MEGVLKEGGYWGSLVYIFEILHIILEQFLHIIPIKFSGDGAW